MSLLTRAESALTRCFDQISSASAPPRLVRAMRHAVFPGGARVRPQLTMAVAIACGDDAPELTNSAACAIELMHCASLVHDDMPAFDDADVRRGKPTVHKLFGEPLALLSGDALIVMAYQVLLLAGNDQPQRLLALMRTINDGVGLPNGIVAGQAWECEVKADLAQYQRAKTGALFVAATCAGAISAGTDQQPWVALGTHLGEAYQVADDIRDVLCQSNDLGKPSGQDALHARPSAATQFGLSGAIEYFQSLIDSAVASIPSCTCRDMLQQMVLRESERMVPSTTCSVYSSRPTASATAAFAQ